MNLSLCVQTDRQCRLLAVLQWSPGIKLMPEISSFDIFMLVSQGDTPDRCNMKYDYDFFAQKVG